MTERAARHPSMRLVLLAFVAWVGSIAGAAPQWPQCSVRSGVQGAPAILINGAPYAPILFVANNQFGRDEVLVDELRLAAGAGIKLFGIGVGLDWFSTPEKEAEVIDKFCKAHPEGVFSCAHLAGSESGVVEGTP